MSESASEGFGKFVPGFDFLQNLAKGASQSIPQLPHLANWVAPSLNLEDLEKRIDELKAVHFWLEQNSKALGATIQALEVQKMTLATLKGMNFNMADLAGAFKTKSSEAVPPKPAAKATRATEPGAEPVASPAGLIDPMQLWGALTQQFQQIAASALQEVAHRAGNGTGASATQAAAASKAPARKRAAKTPAAPRKAPARGR